MTKKDKTPKYSMRVNQTHKKLEKTSQRQVNKEEIRRCPRGDRLK